LPVAPGWVSWLRSNASKDHRHPGDNLTFLDHAEIEAWPSAGGQQRSHLRLIHAYPDAVAGDPGLRHLEQGSSNPVAVADAHLVIRQALDGEVFTELPRHQAAAAKPLLPVAM
jgi:hypothetical protein